MAKSKETYNKKEKEKTKQKKRRDKEQKKEQRKANASEGGRSFEDMIAYVDEDGNLSSTPPDPRKKRKINAEDIELGVPQREQVDTVRKGKISYFNDEKGYGFIVDQDTRESIFVHVNGLTEPVKLNDKVTFEVEKSPKGPSAIFVKIMQ